MKYLATLFLFSTLTAAPIKVPQHRYEKTPNTRDHPGLYPFIGHLTFRNICDHIIDQSTEYFDPDQVQQGDTIYLNLWYIEWFTEIVHDQIKCPYILVSGDVGDFLPHPKDQKLLYDSKCAAWFCRNMVFTYHPKLFQLPMGQDITLFTFDHDEIKFLLEESNKKHDVKNLLYMCFYPRPFGKRPEVVKLFENQPFCFSRNRSDQPFQMISRPQLYQEMAESHFVLSPLGYETDSVRTWETLSLGSIPIVEHTFQDQIYEGLPVVIVHDWEEITEEFLHKKYQELKDLKRDKARFDYWHNLIKDMQKKVRANDLSFTGLENTKFSEQDLRDLTSILKGKDFLIYAGYFTAARSFQLAQTDLFSKIFLFDSYLEDSSLNYFPNELLENQDLVCHYPSGPWLYDLFWATAYDCFFFDLSYFRTSLFNRDYKIEPHSLKLDLLTLFLISPSGTLICGNMANDTYVSEVIEKLNNENPYLHFQKKGNFWFVSK